MSKSLPMTLQRRIWLAFLLILVVGMAVSWRIVFLGDSVQAVNRAFISEKLPLSQRIGQLRGVIADEERILYEYYSYTASRESFLKQRAQYDLKLNAIVSELENDGQSAEKVGELKEKLTELGQLSDALYETLSVSEVDWDKARAILSRIKPLVRQIEDILASLISANQAAVDLLGKDSQSSVSTMVRWVIGFSVLIFGVAFFVGYYVVAIIREGAERRRLALFAERDPNPVLRLDDNGKVLYFNPATTVILGYLQLPLNTPEELLPSDLADHLVATRSASSLNTHFEYSRAENSFECSLSYLADFGEFHAYLKDVTARKMAEDQLEYHAYFDAASGLPNQYKLRDDLESALLDRSATSVMMIVADQEQQIMESFGAAVTEKWLLEVAQRLSDCALDEEEKFYRFGGNAFVLSSRFPSARQRARQLLQSAQQPLLVEGHEIFSTYSIGIALSGFEDGNVEGILHQAASSCNFVRRDGGDNFAIYDESMSRAAANALMLATDLQHAIGNNELRLHYQPKIESVSGRLVGMEALVRWLHPERGMVHPTEFIPVAEDCGLIESIGKWVLFEACRQNAEWQRLNLHPLRVAVNLSARQFRSGKLLQTIDDALDSSGLPVESLEVEITESMVMHDPEEVILLLDKIRRRGIHIALDDFGTGHSSLAYLKRFPIDCLKIDRAFVKDIPGNADDVAIAKTILAMAKALGMSTVAEGVETVEQFELLRELNCDLIQGYYFSRPLSAEEFLALYRAMENSRAPHSSPP